MAHSSATQCAGLLEFLIIDQNFAGKDQRLRPLTRGGESAIHQKFVESSLQARRDFFYHESASTRFSAKC